MAISAEATLSRAWYGGSFARLATESDESIIGNLLLASAFAPTSEQVQAWQVQIAYLKSWTCGQAGTVFLEFNIPRMGRRIDAVLLIESVVFVVEFKVGSSSFERAAVDQVWDYALDLKNFHETSHPIPIIPILVSTDAKRSHSRELHFSSDGVALPICACPDDVPHVIRESVGRVDGGPIDVNVWYTGSYRPTPTIVEAARSLYARHSVEDIARHDAGAANLRSTSRRIESLIEIARKTSKKIICFVTGVPGAGKTLVGLNVATRQEETAGRAHAVFLSGNGPLVAVLREALARDELRRRRESGEKVTKSVVSEPIKTFIQNVHHFRDEALRESKPPIDRVVIFDEAQRAWNLRQTASFMKRRKKQAAFHSSEPEFLIRYMDRHADWALIVCLVGGGQEINTGEAGIGEWLRACNTHFPHWEMHISPSLTGSEYAAGEALKIIAQRRGVHFDGDLHLAVSMRSFRAETVSGFVKSLLDCDVDAARRAAAGFRGRYPIVLTRDIHAARRWLRKQARGTERCGLMASSKAMRLKPHALDIRVNINPVHWFLNDRTDTRSSDFLEDCATEFQVQGLEVDWACINWDADLRYHGGQWSFHDFVGSKWTNVRQEERREYLKNAYRVLLTRARQGMVIFVPKGDPSDRTRDAKYYDGTFRYLKALGIEEVG